MARDPEYIQNQFKWFGGWYKPIYVTSYVTVSANGISNGLSGFPNDGAMFGPDTPLNNDFSSGQKTQTSGIQEALNYLTKNRTEKQKIVVIGEDIDFTGTVSISSYTILDLSQASFTPSGTNQLFNIYYVHDVDVYGGKFTIKDKIAIQVFGDDSLGVAYNINLTGQKYYGDTTSHFLNVGYNIGTSLPTYYNYNVNITDFEIDGSSATSLSTYEASIITNTRSSTITGYVHDLASGSAGFALYAYCQDIDVTMRFYNNSTKNMYMAQSQECKVTVFSNDTGTNYSLDIHDCSKITSAVYAYASSNATEAIAISDFGASTFDGHASLFQGSDNLIFKGHTYAWSAPVICRTINTNVTKSFMITDFTFEDYSSGYTYAPIEVSGTNGLITGNFTVKNITNASSGKTAIYSLGLLSTPFNSTYMGIVAFQSGSSATPTASTNYTVFGTDVLINSSGGTSVSITITDNENNTVASGLTTLVNYPLKSGWHINFGSFTVSPTVSVWGNN